MWIVDVVAFTDRLHFNLDPFGVEALRLKNQDARGTIDELQDAFLGPAQGDSRRQKRLVRFNFVFAWRTVLPWRLPWTR